jgi:hypothetical protein
MACAIFLLALGAGCARQGCPGCMTPNVLAEGTPEAPEGSLSCPYSVSHLDFSTISKPTLLILSGGASHGAWGAGVITGWSTNGSDPRPQFDVVTGISVGALQAVPAFLGSGYDNLLYEFFTQSDDDDIFGPPDLLHLNALQTRGPLRQKIIDNVTREVVLEVAKSPQNDNREVFVGTVNLDTSEFCPWNLSTIARKAKDAVDAGDETKAQCWVNLFRKAIFAASGAPVLAPPVRINSNACTERPEQSMLHADGGVRSRVFIGDVLGRAEATASSPPTAYVVMNGKVVTHPECVENSLAPIALRTFEIMDREALFGSLHAIMTETKSRSMNPAPTINVKISRIPDKYCLRFPSSKFDKVLMGCLYGTGQRWAQQSTIPWETTVPTASAAAWPPDNAAPPYTCTREMGKCTCISPLPVQTPGCPPDEQIP